jgi:hypothetical protein
MEISVNEGFDIIDLEVNCKIKPFIRHHRRADQRTCRRRPQPGTLRADLTRELERPGFGCPVLEITYS